MDKIQIIFLIFRFLEFKLGFKLNKKNKKNCLKSKNAKYTIYVPYEQLF